MARKSGQGKEEEESRARQQKEKTPVRDEEKTPACHGRGHHVVEQEMLFQILFYSAVQPIKAELDVEEPVYGYLHIDSVRAELNWKTLLVVSIVYLLAAAGNGVGYEADYPHTLMIINVECQVYDERSLGSCVYVSLQIKGSDLAMARKAGQWEEEEEARARLQEEKKPARHEGREDVGVTGSGPELKTTLSKFWLGKCSEMAGRDAMRTIKSEE
ncbi:hypothetical protein STEG23_022853 [Scotinomys teguina]